MMRARARRAIKETKKKSWRDVFCSKLVNVSVKNQRRRHMWFHIAKDTHLIEGNV